MQVITKEEIREAVRETVKEVVQSELMKARAFLVSFVSDKRPLA